MGVNNTVLSDVTMKGGSQSALVKALENANQHIIGMDVKGGKKDANAKKEPKAKR